MARSYLYQTAVPTSETEVTYSAQDTKLGKKRHEKSVTQVTLLPKDNHARGDEATLMSSIDAHNIKKRGMGVFQDEAKKSGNHNNGNGINSGKIKYTDIWLSKTPLPVIGGRLYDFVFVDVSYS